MRIIPCSVTDPIPDHGCEYMTRGTVAVLGKCGRNFAAGMNHGIALCWMKKGDFAEKRCNTASVDLEPVPESEAALLRGQPLLPILQHPRAARALGGLHMERQAAVA
jgi:glutamate synthase domain-containing protein 3